MARRINRELHEVATRVLESRARMPYADLAARAARGETEAFEEALANDAIQVEVQYFFDAGRHGPVRITVSVDDGGLRSVVPLVRDTLVDRGMDS